MIGSSGGSEAWSAELDAVAALSTTGLVARTGAHTYAPRSMTAPVAGMTITNPDGVSGSPTFVLANDLLALENLSTTGFLRCARARMRMGAAAALTQPAAGLAITNPDGVAGSPTFALANDLAALEGLASTGIAVRTGADSWAQRSLTQPVAGLTVSNADGSAGNPTFTLANDLLALEGLSSTGIAVRTGTDAWTQRAITGTSGEIAVTNGDGVSGAPTLGLPASLTFTGKTVTGGTFTSPAINSLADPVNPQDAATKNYIDTAIQGMNVKPSVKAASTSSLTHNGTQTIDGVSCLAGDRVLDKDNSSAGLRGIWIVASGSWTRATDMDSWSEIPGAFCFVELGTVNAGTGWFCTAIPVGGTLGSTAMVWSQIAGSGTYAAGSGLSLSGSQFSSVIGSSGGSEAWSAELDAIAGLSTTGLVARTAAHTYTQRAITGTSGEIAVTNGDGVGGAPTLGLLHVADLHRQDGDRRHRFASPAAITGLPDPTNAQDAATKNYVDATAQGLDIKPSVKAATTASISHSGQQTIDGVFCIAGDRVLDKNNLPPALNGIWIVATGAWTRATDMDSWNEVPGAFCFVEQGTTNADTGRVCTADQGGTMGTTAITWSQFAGVGTYSAGSGLALSGTQFSAVIGSSGGSEAWSAELDAVAAAQHDRPRRAHGRAHLCAAHHCKVPSTGNGLTISNGDGIAGNPTIVPSDDLAALEALTGTNTIYYRSGTSTWSPVTAGGMLAFSGGTLNAAPSTDGTMGAGSPSDTVISSQKAIKTYVDQIISAQDAMVFKGSTDCSGNPNYPAGNRGDTYRVSVAGKIGGAEAAVNVEAGDLYICLTDGTASGNQTVSGANWTVAQANLDGAVIGPASAASANFATFSGKNDTGKLIQDAAAVAIFDRHDDELGHGRLQLPRADAARDGAVGHGQLSAARCRPDRARRRERDRTRSITARSAAPGAGSRSAACCPSPPASLNAAPSTVLMSLGGALMSDTVLSSQKAVRTYANANIGGQAISTDTLAQGQNWVWDTASTTFKGGTITRRRTSSSTPPSDVWQESTSYAPSAGPRPRSTPPISGKSAPRALRPIRRAAGGRDQQFAHTRSRSSATPSQTNNDEDQAQPSSSRPGRGDVSRGQDGDRLVRSRCRHHLHRKRAVHLPLWRHRRRRGPGHPRLRDRVHDLALERCVGQLERAGRERGHGGTHRLTAFDRAQRRHRAGAGDRHRRVCQRLGGCRRQLHHRQREARIRQHRHALPQARLRERSGALPAALSEILQRQPGAGAEHRHDDGRSALAACLRRRGDREHACPADDADAHLARGHALQPVRHERAGAQRDLEPQLREQHRGEHQRHRLRDHRQQSDQRRWPGRLAGRALDRRRAAVAPRIADRFRSTSHR